MIMLNVRFALITVSDSCSRGQKEDKSGPALQRLIESSKLFNGRVAFFKVLPDEQEQIGWELIELVSLKDSPRAVDIVITVGGTGFSERDVTPEATKAVIMKEANGLTVALLNRSLQATKNAALSRLCAGIRGNTLIVNFPGSTKAVKECWEVLDPLVNHIVALLRDDQKSISIEHRNLLANAGNCDCSRSNDSKSLAVANSVTSRPRHSIYPLISVEEAFDIISLHCPPTQCSKLIDVMDSVSYVLADDVIAPESVPPFAASIKDGYAVIARDGAGSRKVVGSSEAGSDECGILSVHPGSCIRISTGAPVPINADAVVQVEDTEVLEEKDGEEVKILIKTTPALGQDIRPAGSDIAEGQCVLIKGCPVQSSELGILTSIGCGRIPVWAKPSLAILSTGNELVPYSTPAPLPSGKIRDSNGPMLKALFEQHSFLVRAMGVAIDDLKRLTDELSRLFTLADVVVTSGGVSMGEKDLLKTVLVNKFDFSVHFGRVLMKPGKPTTFATGVYNGSKKCVFALPGNPVSAWVTAHLFVLPALRRMSGFEEYNFSTISVRLANDFWSLDARPEYCRAKLIPTTDKDDPTLKALILEPNQISSRLLSNRNANLLLKLPAKSAARTSLSRNDLIDALVINKL